MPYFYQKKTIIKWKHVLLTYVNVLLLQFHLKIDLSFVLLILKDFLNFSFKNYPLSSCRFFLQTDSHKRHFFLIEFNVKIPPFLTFSIKFYQLIFIDLWIRLIISRNVLFMMHHINLQYVKKFILFYRFYYLTSSKE